MFLRLLSTNCKIVSCESTYQSALLPTMYESAYSIILVSIIVTRHNATHWRCSGKQDRQDLYPYKDYN